MDTTIKLILLDKQLTKEEQSNIYRDLSNLVEDYCQNSIIRFVKR